MAFQIPALKYAVDALEPYIDAQTLTVHHDGHHVTYTNNLNAALENYPEWQAKSAEDILRQINEVPEAIRTAVRNNGGGYVNHNLFWEVMSPKGGGTPKGELASAIDKVFGTFDNFRDQFSKAAATRFASGWAWLSVDAAGELVLQSTANQDSPLSEGLTPIMTLDVWEHAYYLKYKNKRADFIGAWWNVVDWDRVAEYYTAALKK